MTDKLLSCEQGEFKLERLPLRRNEQFRAWDAADEYLLAHLSEEISSDQLSRILIINDAFGALSVALNQYERSNISDSLLAQNATKANLKFNNLNSDNIKFIDSLTIPQDQFDFVLIKVPKTLALLEDQLCRLRDNLKLNPDIRAQVIVAGMVKNMSNNVWKIIEKYLGSTTTSLAKKKAKLIFVEPDLTKPMPENPYPIIYQLENTNYSLTNHANVFSRDSLDIGTRFLLQNLPKKDDVKCIIDLGCGNGVVGLMLAEKYPNADLSFIDESYMAVASSETTFQSNFPDRNNATFLVNDSLSGIEKQSADLIVCNPPFHQQHAMGDHISAQMFKQSRDVLKINGELWVIGNRHLNYKNLLNKTFGNAEIVAANKKFVICKAVA